MKSGEFTLNGIPSSEYGMVIQDRPVIQSPPRKMEFQPMLGRDGELLFDDETYDDVETSLNIAVTSTKYNGLNEFDKLSRIRRDVLQLFTPGRYVKFTPYYDPRVEYDILLNGSIEFINKYYLYGNMVCTVPIRIKAKKLLIGYPGSSMPPSETSMTVDNPTNEIARPLISLSGSGTVILNFGGRAFKIVGAVPNMVIDCETEQAYTVSATNGEILTNQNSKIETYDFPYLGPGRTMITKNGSVTRLHILERWCTLV